MTVVCKGTGTLQDPGAARGAVRVGPGSLVGNSSPGRGSLEKGPHQSVPQRPPEVEGPVPAPRNPLRRKLSALRVLRTRFCIWKRQPPLAAASSVPELGFMFSFWVHLRSHYHLPASRPLGLGVAGRAEPGPRRSPRCPLSGTHVAQPGLRPCKPCSGLTVEAPLRRSLSGRCRNAWTAVQNSLQLPLLELLWFSHYPASIRC